MVRPYTEPFDYEFDVCVVGAGGCGLTAAIAAAKAGADVVILEKDKTPAGATAMSYGAICAAGTRFQREVGIVDTADALYEDIIAATRGETDARIARVMADEGARTVEWLADEVGCDFRIETDWGGYGHDVPRMHVSPNRSGEEVLSMLIDGAAEAGANLVTEAAVIDLVVDEDRRVRGVVYESPEGEQSVGCKALVLASSGYGANPDMIARFIPEMTEATYFGCENHGGDAIRWGEQMGAKLGDMGAFQGLGTLASPQNVIVPHVVLIRGGFHVDGDGRRFHNEMHNISGQGRSVIANTGGQSYIIYDQRGHEAGLRFADYRDGAELLTRGKTGDTIEAVAKAARIDPAGLKETFAEVEAAIASGEPDRFGRTFGPDDALVPPYYAVRATGALFHTQGGLCIDETMAVLGEDGTPFPNLFAGGGAVRSVSGPSDWGYLPAMGMATATVFGRLAGESAARVAAQSNVTA